jgi:hypothetical protein
MPESSATLSALSSFKHTGAKMSEFLLHLRIFELLVIAVAFNASARAEWRTPYTESESEVAVPMGAPGVRAWADVPLSVLRGQGAHLPALNAGHQFSIVALSGGGEHGAFGGDRQCAVYNDRVGWQRPDLLGIEDRIDPFSLEPP